jgi:hypothetical protein
MTRDRKVQAPWRAPTRRVFATMLGTMIGAAAAALATRGTALLPSGEALDDERPRSTWQGTTRWIGHC